MNPIDIVLIAVIALIISGAAAYIIKAKKGGKKCIGCPDSASCGKKCSGCGGNDGCGGKCGNCNCEEK